MHGRKEFTGVRIVPSRRTAAPQAFKQVIAKLVTRRPQVTRPVSANCCWLPLVLSRRTRQQSWGMYSATYFDSCYVLFSVKLASNHVLSGRARCTSIAHLQAVHDAYRNVMTVNIGPQGETYEYYSACGPILAGDYTEASLYYEAGKEGLIPEGCPEQACVVAGTLEFGEKWEQNFAIGLVWFTLISSLALWVYYTWATFKATCGWEEFYVVNMESKRPTVWLQTGILLRMSFVEPRLVQFYE